MVRVLPRGFEVDFGADFVLGCRNVGHHVQRNVPDIFLCVKSASISGHQLFLHGSRGVCALGWFLFTDAQ